MDPVQHERFLEYLERFEYFGRGGSPRLSSAEFAACDDELRRLAALDRRGPEEEEALRTLRTLLLRD